MAAHKIYLFLLAFLYITESDDQQRQRKVCDIKQETCTVEPIDRNEETLGQKMLKKQTEVYGLTKLSYSEESAAQSIKIYNPNDVIYDYYWFDMHRNKGIYKGKLRAQSQTATNSYRGHIFYFNEVGTENEVYRITVTKNVNDYIIPPTSDKLNDPFYLKLQEKKAFYAEYFKETGYPWLTYYNRPKPVLFMYNKEGTDPIGTIYSVSTPHSFWNCIPDDGLSAAAQSALCQSKEDISVNVEVISVTPRMFTIEHIISDSEAEMVKKLATPKLHRSGTGQAIDSNYNDETRTSKTAWIGHREHPIIDTIFKRTADILQIEENVLKRNAEHMQSVYYTQGQEYKAHHDFSDNGRDAATRYITILFYLTDQEDDTVGGETWFPKARDGKGIKAHPGKGNAVMFYNLLPDGNGDDLTLHEAVQVKRGDKWICNFWIWDPKKPFR